MGSGVRLCREPDLNLDIWLFFNQGVLVPR